MQFSETIITKPDVSIDTDTLLQLKTITQEESQVIVHCSYTSQGFMDLIRIWPTTYLIDKGSDNKSELVHAVNVSLAPIWTRLEYGETRVFTLIFSGLPKSCTVFDFIESVPEPNGFEIRNIKRNASDVYFVEV
jgi:hypothetical protein